VTLTISALGVNVAVELADDFALRNVVESLLATYPRSNDEPALTYRLTSTTFHRDGVVQTLEHADDVVPIFEIDLYERVVEKSPLGWLLHASGVVIGGQALVFAGPSGAGKTTLALELGRRGHKLLSEEIIGMDRDAIAIGLPRPLHVLEDRVENIPENWRRVRYPLRGAAPRCLAIPPVSALAHEPVRVRALVRLTHGADRAPGLQLLQPSDALPRLWDPTLRADDRALEVATQVLRSVPAYRLASRTFEEAILVCEDLLERA
jgi:hypothetical protein